MSTLPHAPLREFVGKVVKISPKYKAVVQFKLGKQNERALLWYDKIKVNDESLPVEGTIDQYIEIGSTLKFLCHSFDEKGVDKCRWYITCAWQQEAKPLDLSKHETILNGMYNHTGQIVKVAQRQGILSFTLNGKEENVLFLGSKLYISGKRVPAKTNLTQLAGLEEGRYLCFDAVPCDPPDGTHGWFATVVWKGHKPDMAYDVVNRKKPSSAMTKIAEIKMVTSDPHSQFLRCEGQVLGILNPEYGLALGAIKCNNYETVLFHRSMVTLAKRNLANDDLSTIFEEGDRLRLVAAAAPKTMGVQWVASQVRIFVDPSISHLFPF